MTTKYCIALCEEEGFRGTYDSREEAAESARTKWQDNDEGHGFTVYTAEIGSPPKASEFAPDAWQIADLLRLNLEGSDYGCDASSDWPDCSDDQADDLAARIAKVVDEWATDHGLQPKFYDVHEVQSHRVSADADHSCESAVEP